MDDSDDYSWYPNENFGPLWTEHQDDYAVIVKPKVYSNGHKCLKCQEFFPYAEANKDDGSFQCWACKHY